VDGLAGTRFVDAAAPANVPLFYVVLAESLDRPGCGDGPLVRGSTDTLEIGPATDVSDVVPPAGTVGDTLRATDHADDTVDFVWPLAPPLGPGESFAILRADDDPRGPFTRQALVGAPAWTDPAAPPRFSPVHVWFYDVRVADACANVSAD
jgi:hypothetical protein